MRSLLQPELMHCSTGSPGKRLGFWESGREDWPPEMISQSVELINDHTR